MKTLLKSTCLIVLHLFEIVRTESLIGLGLDIFGQVMSGLDLYNTVPNLGPCQNSTITTLTNLNFSFQNFTEAFTRKPDHNWKKMLYLKSIFAFTDSMGELADVIPFCYHTN